MSQLSQHRQRAPSLGIPPLSNTRPSPLSSHPPTPVELIAGGYVESSIRISISSSGRSGNRQLPDNGKHEREVSTSSLPFGSPSSSFPRKHPSLSNFSTPDLSKSASHSTESLFRQDTNSFQLHRLPLAYQLSNPSTSSSKLDLANLSTMSSSPHDNHRHDSFRSTLPVPNGPSTNGRRRSISMQKLFSLSSLKSGFGNSHTSLVSTPSQNPPHSASSDRPISNSTTSSRGIKRAADEDFVLVKNGQDSRQSPLRKRKSSSWFRRKSGLFSFASHNANSPVVDDYDMPQGPDAMVMDEPQDVRPTTQHTVQTDSSSERTASVYTSQPSQPPVLPPLSPMSKTQTQSSQYSQIQRPASHRSNSSRSRVSRSSSQNQTPYSHSARETFSPPPTLPELTRIETSFDDTDMGDLFANIGR